METRILSEAEIPGASLNGRRPEQLKIPELRLWLVCEAEIPGASLNGRRPEQLKIPELRLWLAIVCRRAPTKGKKADLVERYKMLMCSVLLVLH